MTEINFSDLIKAASGIMFFASSLICMIYLHKAENALENENDKKHKKCMFEFFWWFFLMTFAGLSFVIPYPTVN